MGHEWMFNPFFVISSKIDLIKTLDEDSTKNLHKFIVLFMKTNSEFRFDILANVLIWKKYNILGMEQGNTGEYSQRLLGSPS